MSQVVQLNRNSYLQDFDLLLKKDQPKVVNVFGQNFYCIESSKKFKMQWDSNGLISMEVGRGFALRGDDYFEQLTFVNDSSDDDISLTFTAGRAEVFDTRLNTLLERIIAIGVLAAPTRGVATAVAAAATVAILGTNDSDRRKQIVVTNEDLDGSVIVQKSDGTKFCTVFPQTAWTLETNMDLKVFNNTATDLVVAELYYDV